MISDSKIMTKTFHAALSPLLFVGSICGFGLLEYPLGRPRIYFSCLYFSITWSLYAYIFYYLVYASHTSYIYMSFFSNLLLVITIITMIVSLFRFKGLKTCLHKLSIVDDTLEMLGISKEYQQLYKRAIYIIIGWMIMSCIMSTLDSFWLSLQYFSISRILVPFVGNHLIHVNILNALTWGIILGYTGSRFQKVNEYICNLLKDDKGRTKRPNKLLLVNQQRVEVKEFKQYMWIIMHVHLHLCHISYELNKVFSIQMTLQMASYFLIFFSICSDIYTKYIMENTAVIEQLLDNIFIYMWTIVISVELLGLNHICETVCDEANETIAILYKLSNDDLDEDLREQILQFILQIKQRKVRFSGMGLFNFGYGFIRRFYKSILTALVIIIQMRITLSSTDDET